MIDFHTHLLPNMDDGSQSVEETRLMLDELTAQGVDAVVLTPHFYPLADTVKNFFEKREKSLNALLTVYDKEVHPALYLGAEVAYFHGISRAEDLREMCIQGTNLFLLELPFCKWDDALVSEVFELMENLSVKVVLAHINRYLPHKNAKYLDIMQKGGVLLQANAEWFLEKRPLKKALKYLKAEKISCLGSDAHNLLTRPPRFKEALINVQNKIGDDKLKAIDLTTKKILSKATKV